jgi:hypothetical protein
MSVTPRQQVELIGPIIRRITSSISDLTLEIHHKDEEMCSQLEDEAKLAQTRAQLATIMTTTVGECGALDHEIQQLCLCVRTCLEIVRGYLVGRDGKPVMSLNLQRLEPALNDLQYCGRAAAQVQGWVNQALTVLREEIAFFARRFAGVAESYCQRVGVLVPPGQVATFAFEPIDTVRQRMIALSGGRAVEIERIFRYVATRHWDMCSVVTGMNYVIGQLQGMADALQREQTDAEAQAANIPQPGGCTICCTVMRELCLIL